MKIKLEKSDWLCAWGAVKVLIIINVLGVVLTWAIFK